MTGLETLRARVARANIAIHDAGLVTLSFGNVSAIDREAGVILIKPSGLAYAELSTESIVAVGLDDGHVAGEALRPSTDTPTHRHLYREFPDIGAIVHTHSPSATAWAQAGRPIPCLGTTHADYFRGAIPVSRPLRPDEIGGDYEWETGRVIVETLVAGGLHAADTPAVLVGSHGPFVWGPSPEAAVENAIALEAVAAMAYQTISIAADVAEIGADLLSRHFDRKHGETAYYGQPRRP